MSDKELTFQKFLADHGWSPLREPDRVATEIGAAGSAFMSGIIQFREVVRSHPNQLESFGVYVPDGFSVDEIEPLLTEYFGLLGFQLDAENAEIYSDRIVANILPQGEECRNIIMTKLDVGGNRDYYMVAVWDFFRSIREGDDGEP